MVFTLSFSVKTFFASLVGLIVPYWFAAGYFFYTDNIQGLADHFCEFINYSELFDYSQVTDHQVLNLSLLPCSPSSVPSTSYAPATAIRYEPA